MMKWVPKFQLILLDFDGLLVNTEELHFAAYKEMCRARGYALAWDFTRYCEVAHFSSVGLRNAIYATFPELHAKEPRWEVLYQEKKRAYQRILAEGKLHLMPGVAELLEVMQKAGVKRCVVTNSTREQVEAIKRSIPLLRTIPEWITREQYDQPKPAPDGYQRALERLLARGDRVIGFEDTFRGLGALEAAGCPGVLICPKDHPQIQSASDSKTVHFESFIEIPDDLADTLH